MQINSKLDKYTYSESNGRETNLYWFFFLILRKSKISREESLKSLKSFPFW